MKRIRFFLLWVLAAALCLSLCACGGGAAAPAEPEPTETPAAAEAPTAEPTAEPEPTEAPEPLDSGAAVDAVIEASPIELYEMKDIFASSQPDKSWVVTFTSVYGDFLYIVDGYTGEILERDEPDLSAAGDVKKMMSSEEALDCVDAVSPVGLELRRDLKVSKYPDRDAWIVTFTTDQGDFSYVVDGYTGEILEKEEPDLSAAVQTTLSAENALDAVYKILPIERSQMKNIKVSRDSTGIWYVTFTSDYGDFLYGVDMHTGQIVEREEPDISAAIASGARVALTTQQIFNAVFDATPVKPQDRNDLRLSKNADDSWTVTFESPWGQFLYVVDGYTGEILDKDEPEIP